MYKLFLAFLYFGLTGCINHKAEPVKTNQPSLPMDRVGTPLKVQSKEQFATAFAANVVTEMGKAIHGIFQDRNGNYWFATNGEGVFYYDGLSLFQFTTKDGLSDHQVLTIKEDKEGNIWLLTINGICRFDGKMFTSFPSKNNQAFFANPVLKIETDDLWFEVGGTPISVVTGEQLEHTGAFNVNRMKEIVPSVPLYSSIPRNTGLSIRGLGTTFGVTNDGIDPAVEFYTKPDQFNFQI